MFNLAGVLASSGAVAFGIISLLPVELILQVGTGAGFAMVFALLIAAILWNLGTWGFGLPASSSHTMVGSIIGVGLRISFSRSQRDFGRGLGASEKVAEALLISPLFGFRCCRSAVAPEIDRPQFPALYASPRTSSPPLSIRGI